MSLFQKIIRRQFRKNETLLHPLNYLFWECTWRCNLACLHCGSDCQSDTTVKDMPFEYFLKAIQPLKEKYKRDSIVVAITGGEPLLRSDLADCGLRLRKEGFRWGIVTNGFAYTEAMHHKLLAAGMGAITLSVDGLEETHNWLRNNRHSFQKAMQALDLIVSSPRLNYDVVTCVHQRNIHELEALKQLLIKHKVKTWRLFTIAPIGRAANNPEMMLDGKALHQLMDFIVKSRKEGIIDVKFSCEAYVGNYEFKVKDSFFFCRAGINIASVLIDGSISACPNIHRSFVQGNIYQDNLSDVWDNKFDCMRNRTWMLTGICSNCKAFKNCGGGAMHLWNDKKESILCCLYQKMNKI